MCSWVLTLTRCRTRCDVARPVDGSLPGAVAPVVAWRRVVAQALGELHPTSARSGARTPRTPGAPAAMVGRLGGGRGDAKERKGKMKEEIRVGGGGRGDERGQLELIRHVGSQGHVSQGRLCGDTSNIKKVVVCKVAVERDRETDRGTLTSCDND